MKFLPLLPQRISWADRLVSSVEVATQAERLDALRPGREQQVENVRRVLFQEVAMVRWIAIGIVTHDRDVGQAFCDLVIWLFGDLRTTCGAHVLKSPNHQITKSPNASVAIISQTPSRSERA